MGVMETAMLLQAPESLRAEASGAAPLFSVGAEGTLFRGRRVIRRKATVAGVAIEVATLKDAAELLDDPELLDHFHRTDRLPYGLELWPSALMLSQHLTNDGPGAGREAVELGCGVGFASIFAAKAGWRIAATDADPLALRFTEFNAKLNEASLASLEFLDWMSPPSDRKFARVLAADVLYQTSDHSPLLNCIQAVLADDGLAVVADPCRGAAEKFEARARDAAFDVRHFPTSAQLEGESPARGQIFELRWA